VWVELDQSPPYATLCLRRELKGLMQFLLIPARVQDSMNPAIRQAILREGVSVGVVIRSAGTCKRRQAIRSCWWSRPSKSCQPISLRVPTACSMLLLPRMSGLLCSMAGPRPWKA
jgi:hypothetical protein